MMETWHPLGVTGIITAFNFPVAVWSWNAALALVCGNALIWKPSEKTPLTALTVQHLLDRAITRFGDAPPGLSSVLIGGRAVGEALADDPRVPLVSATGSTAMGRAIAPRLASRGWRDLCWNSAATMPRSSAPRPISIWRCAPSPSQRWAPPASAAPHCAACSSTRASGTRCWSGWSVPMARSLSAIRARQARWSAR